MDPVGIVCCLLQDYGPAPSPGQVPVKPGSQDRVGLTENWLEREKIFAARQSVPLVLEVVPFLPLEEPTLKTNGED